MKNKNLLEAEGISKRFGRREVLRSVDLRLTGGELVGVVGENGSGKSTLLKILVGLLPPTARTVTPNNRTGYCPQDTLAFEQLTVRENFRYFATACGLDPHKEDKGWVRTMNHLLDRFHFKQDADSLVSSLSGGTKQKPNLGITLLCLPELIILDEPYAGFDWETHLFFEPRHVVLVMCGFAFGGFVYGCYGLLVGAVFRRELEGILFIALLTNIDAGWLQNPIYYADAQNQALIRHLPAYFPSQVSMVCALTDYSILFHVLGGVTYGVVLLVLALLIYTLRMRLVNR